MKLYGYAAYETLNGMPSIAKATADIKIGPFMSYARLMTLSFDVVESSCSYIRAINDIYLFSTGEVRLARTPSNEVDALIVEMAKGVVKVKEMRSRDLCRRMKTLIKAIEVGGTEWNIPFNPFKQAKLSYAMDDYHENLSRRSINENYRVLDSIFKLFKEDD